MVRSKGRRAGMVQGRAIGVVVRLLVIGAFALFARCSQERGLRPQPVHYNLYAAIEYPGGIDVDVVDTEVDTVLRRIAVGETSYKSIKPSPDGKWLALYNESYLHGIELIDLATETVVAEATGRLIREVCFVPGRSMIIGLTPRSNMDQTYMFGLPGLSVDTILPFSLGYCFPGRTDGQVIGTAFRRNPSTQLLDNILLTYNTDDWSVVDSFSLSTSMSGTPVASLNVTLSPDGERVYFLGGDEANGLGAYAFEVQSHALLWRTPMRESFGWIQATPDGREVWATQSFSAFTTDPPPADLGFLVMLDANTGRQIDSLGTLGISLESPGHPMPVRQIQFHPTQRKAYVAGWGMRPGILVIDMDTKEVLDFIYDEVHQNVWDIAIAPG